MRAACWICGSDLHFLDHGFQMVKLAREMTGMPIEGGLPVDVAGDVFMGHEFSAEVLEAGPETDAPPAGTAVTSLPVLLSPKGFEPILSSNATFGGYAEGMLLSSPLLLPMPGRPGSAARRSHRADGGRAARGEQVLDQAGRGGTDHRMRAASPSRSSPRFAAAASKACGADYHRCLVNYR